MKGTVHVRYCPAIDGMACERSTGIVGYASGMSSVSSNPLSSPCGVTLPMLSNDVVRSMQVGTRTGQ